MTDYNCFVGAWPFRKIRHGTLEDLRRLHEENGITDGFVSSSDAVFYQDPYEADEDLARMLSGSRYRLIMTVNPRSTGAVASIDEGIKMLGAKGVRLYPGFHGYELTQACVTKVVERVRNHCSMLYLTLRVDDERTAYLFQPRTIETDEIRRFLLENEDVPIMLCNIRLYELSALKDILLSRDNVWFDCSGLKDYLFPKEELEKMGLLGRLRYGSMAPFFCMKSTVLLMEEAISSQKTEDEG